MLEAETTATGDNAAATASASPAPLIPPMSTLEDPTALVPPPDNTAAEAAEAAGSMGDCSTN